MLRVVLVLASLPVAVAPALAKGRYDILDDGHPEDKAFDVRRKFPHGRWKTLRAAYMYQEGCGSASHTPRLTGSPRSSEGSDVLVPVHVGSHRLYHPDPRRRSSLYSMRPEVYVEASGVRTGRGAGPTCAARCAQPWSPMESAWLWRQASRRLATCHVSSRPGGEAFLSPIHAPHSAFASDPSASGSRARAEGTGRRPGAGSGVGTSGFPHSRLESSFELRNSSLARSTL